MLEQMDINQSDLSGAIKQTNLSKLFINGMSNFGHAGLDKQLSTLSLLKKILTKQLVFNNKKLSIIANIISGILMVLIIFSIFGGFVLPRMGAGIGGIS